MTRPTIKDLADAAGVSVSTVNRVLSDASSVRKPTRERVRHAAERIGFYGLGTIDYSIRESAEVHRLGILLQQGNRSFSRDLGAVLTEAAEDYQDGRVELVVEFLDDLSPNNVADRLLAISGDCDAIALVAAEHPLVSEAIDTVLRAGTPVCGLVAPLSARGNVGYIGLDHWKVGRTAAWAFDRMCRERGKIGILVGNHRYRNQDLNESGFRSYLREHNSGFALLEPRSTFESAAVAREMTEELFQEHPDMCGLFISGGGITGAVAALRDINPGRDFVSVGYELIDVTRTALIDGVLTMAICHPRKEVARETITALVKAKRTGPDVGAQSVALGFEIYTSENV